MAQYDLNLVDFWLIVRRRKFIILFTVVLVGVLTSTMPYLVGPPPVFKAAARVKYERSTTASGLLQESISGVGGESDIATQAEVIKSFNVMERVAKAMSLIDKNLESKDIRANHELLDIIYDIQGHVEALQEGTTNIIKITAMAGDPRTAERYATLSADAYREENIYNRNRQVIEAKRFVEGQLKSLAATLHESEQALREFKEQEGQVFVTEEAKQALEQYNKLEGEQERLARVKREVAAQLQSLKESKSVVQEVQSRVYSDEVEALISKLNQRMSDLTQERDLLLINYTPEHALVRELDRRILNVKGEMIRELEAKLRTFDERERAIKESIVRYKERYLSLPQAAIQLARLERDVMVTSNLYAALKSKHQEFMIKGAEQIEEVTRQAQAGSKQATGAAAELTKLAERLAELVKRFKVE